MRGLVNGILIAGGVLAAFYLGRKYQRILDQLVIIELYEKTGPAITDFNTVGYLSFKEDNTIEFVPNIRNASPITLEVALKLKKRLKSQLESNQDLAFMSMGDAQLLAIVEQAEEMQEA